MNDYFISALLGVVEGLTEFLPVSSTAHLRIAEALLSLPLDSGYWKMYTIVIQIGAILVLPVYFRERIAKLLNTFPRGQGGDRNLLTHPLSLAVAAFFVTAIPGFFLTRIIGKNLESLGIMGSALVIGGVLMWAVDARQAAAEKAAALHSPRIRTRQMEEMTLAQAIWIGACQLASAVFPGVSRSMSTITAGQMAGMSRASALEFSFFLSMPTMAAATGYDLLKSISGKGENPIGVAQIDAHGWIVLAIGLLVSFLVAYGAVAWFMAWVRRHGFAPFAVYRILAGTAVLIWAMRLAA